MRFHFGIRGHLALGLFAVVTVSIGMLVTSEIGYSRVQENFNRVIGHVSASTKLSALMGLIADAESSQRGYLLTERPEYLAEYEQVFPKIFPLLEDLRAIYDDVQDPPTRADFTIFADTLPEKLAEFEATVALAKRGRVQQAKEIVLTHIGKEKMDVLRMQVYKLQLRERERTVQSVVRRNFDERLSRIAIALITLLNIALAIGLFRKLHIEMMREEERLKILAEQRIQLDQLVGERTSQLEVLASHLLRVSEDEKSSLARELHDDLGAILTASKMDVSWVRQHLTPEQGDLSDKLQRALKHLDQAVKAKRRLMENLVPSTLTSFGLVVALRELAENMQSVTEWALVLDLPEDNLVLSEAAAIALFRIAQESVNNAAKYAGAKTLMIKLVRENDEVVMDIQDDGKGIDPNRMRPKSYGLSGMRQRMVGLGGTLQIDSHLGKGTRVRARLRPLSAPTDTAPAPLAESL